MIRIITTLLVVSCCSGISLPAEPLSEEALEETTARGRESAVFEVVQGGSTVDLQVPGRGHFSQVIQGQSQTNLKSGAISNAVGRNQIANGVNLR